MAVQEIVDKQNQHISTTLQLYCAPCKAGRRKFAAEGYCESCQEYLCLTCISYHKKLQVSKSHRILQCDANATDTFIETSTTEVCELHSGKFIEYFCDDHQVVGCGPCMITDHINCKVHFILSVANGYKDSSEYRTILNTIREIETQLLQLEKHLETQTKEADYIYSSALNEIRRFRTEINQHLDKKEEHLLQKANQFNFENEKALRNVKDRCEQLRRQYVELNDQLQNHADKVTHLFSVAKRVKTTVVDLNKECQKELTKSCIENYYFRLSQKLKEIILEENSIGKLVKLHKSEVCLLKHELEFDHSISNVPRNEKNRLISSMLLVYPDRLLTADSDNYKLMLFDTCNQTLTSELELKFAPWGVTCLPNSQAAATLPGGTKIQIVSTLGGLSPVREIKVNGSCYGICFSDDKLIVTYLDPGKLEIVSLNGTVYHTLNTDVKGNCIFRKPLYIALQSNTGKNYVYVSDWKTHTVSKLTLDGEIVSRYKNKRFDPFGLVAIGDSHIAVCNRDDHAITIIGNKEGKMTKTKQWDCVKFPRALEFSSEENKLYISSDDCGNIHVYNIVV